MRRRAAFTLVELLIVIGIIAVLISILLPALRKARESAQAATCMANLRTCGQAFQMYASDHRGWIGFGFKTTATGQANNWPIYLSGGNVFYTAADPADVRYEMSRAYLKPSATQYNEVTRCPKQYPDIAGASYGGNSQICNRTDQPADRITLLPTAPVILRRKGANLVNNSGTTLSPGATFLSITSGDRSPAEIPMLADSVDVGNYFGNGSHAQSTTFHIKSTDFYASHTGGVHLRHNSRANILFFDGHVDPVGGRLDASGGELASRYEITAYVTENLTAIYP